MLWCVGGDNAENPPIHEEEHSSREKAGKSLLPFHPLMFLV